MCTPLKLIISLFLQQKFSGIWTLPVILVTFTDTNLQILLTIQWYTLSLLICLVLLYFLFLVRSWLSAWWKRSFNHPFVCPLYSALYIRRLLWCEDTKPTQVVFQSTFKNMFRKFRVIMECCRTHWTASSCLPLCNLSIRHDSSRRLFNRWIITCINSVFMSVLPKSLSDIANEVLYFKSNWFTVFLIEGDIPWLDLTWRSIICSGSSAVVLYLFFV